MTKCDFCSCAVNKNGTLICKWGKDGCSMPQSQVMEILRLLAKMENKK